MKRCFPAMILAAAVLATSAAAQSADEDRIVAALALEQQQRWDEAAVLRGEIAEALSLAQPGTTAEGEALYAWAYALARTPGNDAFPVWDRAIAAFDAAGNWARASGAASAAATDRSNFSDHEGAERLARQGVALAERDGGGEIQGQAWHALGVALSETVDYAEAEAALEKAIALHGGRDRVESARSLDQLGVVLQEAGRHDEAGAALAQALALNERVHGPDSYVLAIGLNNLASLRNAQGRAAEAEALYRRALRIAELNSRANAASVFRSNLGWVLHLQGKDLEAEPLLRAAAEEVEAMLGPAHEDTASAWGNVAGALQGQGRHAEAQVMLRDIVSCYEAAVGRDHLLTAWAINALAASIAETEGAAEAAALFAEAEAITARRLSPGHPDRVRNASDLADNLIDRGEARSALILTRDTGLAVRARLGDARSAGDGAGAKARARRAFALQVRAAWRLAGE